MAPSRTRSQSPLDEPPAKRQKRDDSASSSEGTFAPKLFSEARVQQLASSYESSEPFKYVVLDALFDDELLRSVKDEILRELRFAEKETDIYKVHQTGDLASLSYLPPEQLALFPSLLKLRDALYSPTFRSFLRSVTGCGPLSGKKQDMSINSYKKGCHLLNHDDVIGSRRVSYILYMPVSPDGGWKEEWGGALELYPMVPGREGQQSEPSSMPSKKIPPAWNQFVFFEVQPGRSFHSVEEVVVGTDADGRERLSISGWFHKAQEGEEGYDPGEDATERLRSSLEQLSSSAPVPFTPYPAPLPTFLPATSLSADETSFLSDFLNPIYLEPRSLAVLAQKFAEDSSLQLNDFLCEPLAEKLEQGLRQRDVQDGLGKDRASRIPPHTSGMGDGWELKGPPHKSRYCVLSPPSESTLVSPLSPETDPTVLMRSLKSDLFPSPAFRAWLGLVSSLVPLGHLVEARRFRPGLDYTLAQADDTEARLDVVLGLTPQPQADGKGKAKEDDVKEGGWESLEWGGWECYMAPHEGEEDPAVYQSGSNKANPLTTNGMSNGVNGKGPEQDHDNDEGDLQDEEGEDTQDEDPERVPDEAEQNGEDEDASDEDEEDTSEGTLLTAPAAFNGLLLVMRDAKLMRFVKYVSAAAEGSRWDVCGEWEVGGLEEDDEAQEGVDNTTE